MSKMLLKIELIPHSEQRYETAGDWLFDDEGCLTIRVSDTGHKVDPLLIGLHEAVEAILCREHGVLEPDVTAFDIAFNATHDLSDEEPGEDPKAPYRHQHAVADVVERLIAAEAGVCWKEYNDRVDTLFDGGNVK